jgi:hypothetical protein
MQCGQGLCLPRQPFNCILYTIVPSACRAHGLLSPIAYQTNWQLSSPLFHPWKTLCLLLAPKSKLNSSICCWISGSHWSRAAHYMPTNGLWHKNETYQGHVAHLHQALQSQHYQPFEVTVELPAADGTFDEIGVVVFDFASCPIICPAF